MIAVILLTGNLTIIPMDCVRVRELVAQYGRAQAAAWAMEQMALGTYSWKEFRAAKACLVNGKK
jgi:hypothetical protein